MVGSRAQLEAEILRLRRELATARRGAHVSERVDTEMRRVKRLWQESEHRLLTLQSELRTSQVTQRAVGADLALAEEQLASQAQRIDELVRGSALDLQAQRERADALDAAREATRLARLESAELQLQLASASATVLALTSEVELSSAPPWTARPPTASSSAASTRVLSSARRSTGRSSSCGATGVAAHRGGPTRSSTWC